MKKALHFALIGQHASYSRSPAIFDAIFAEVKQAGQFELMDVAANKLGARIRQAVLDGIRGFAVTIPHKQAVITHLDDIGPIAKILGAVNSICVEDGRLYGLNTDCHGFRLGLKPYARKIKKRPALILGNGGSALAAVFALQRDFEIRKFVIFGRDKERLAQFSGHLLERLERITIDTTTEVSELKKALRSCALIVNCTPLGGWNHPQLSPLPEHVGWGKATVFYDLNYNADNLVQAAATKSGLTVLDGSGMLVGQALRSFDIWTGQAVEFDPVYQAVFAPSKS